MAKNIGNANETAKAEETEVEVKENPIYVKVDETTRHKIDRFKEAGITMSKLIQDAITLYDDFTSLKPEIKGVIEKYKEEEESIINFLEKAVKFYGDQRDLDRDLFLRMREEMKMMLIGKTTFNQLIAAAKAPKDARDMPIKRNVAFDLIMWYNKSRPLKHLTIEEIIETVKKIWVVANYFYVIDVTQENKDEYHMLFRHRQDKNYSEYWLNYFIELFSSKELSCKCMIEGQAFDESISMTIKIGFEK
ncbi:MAG: hypothetical protein ACFFKA_02765 [Candidatus Thorarchaeota archaeon]